jgi:hypothetical protein
MPRESTAKNYLGEKEIDTLNRITAMFLDQAEFHAQRRRGNPRHRGFRFGLQPPKFLI